MSTDRLNAARPRIGAFAGKAPTVCEGGRRISVAAMRNGVFSAAHKERIATAIAVTQGSEDCILCQVAAAQQHGAGEAGLIEAPEVAVEMGGGPPIMYAGKAVEAFRTL